jgi:MAF protein
MEYKKIILASKSPRRAELLSRMGYDFDVVDAGIDENKITADSPAELVKLLAAAKAEGARALFGGNHIIIAADTVVDLNGEVLGKPKDEDDARRMLRALSGTKHYVHTGLCVLDGGRQVFTGTVSAAVWFRELGETELGDYIATGEPADKAGAYGIQERGAVFARRVEGDFYAIVGLPVCPLSSILKEINVK